MKPALRRVLLGSLALGAVALAALASVGSAPDAGDAAPSAPARARAGDAPPRRFAALDLGRAFQSRPVPEVDDAFRARNWDPAPLPPSATAKAGPPPKPVPPPLPFKYLGRMEEDGKTTVFLQRGNDVVVARPSQPIDASYRVETVDPREVVFTYLPLKARQVLTLTAQK